MVSSMIRSKTLTKGERLTVLRRREGVTQAKAAKARGLSVYLYRRFEEGLDVDECPTVRPFSLRPNETCFLLRSRAGLNLDEMSELTAYSRTWLTKMERGSVDCAPLVAAWLKSEKLGPHRKRATAKR